MHITYWLHAHYLPVACTLLTGVHESQSLLWERMVLQSAAFWDYATPLFHERFPFTSDATADDFYKTYNRVEPGCIRVEADEVTAGPHSSPIDLLLTSIGPLPPTSPIHLSHPPLAPPRR